MTRRLGEAVVAFGRFWRDVLVGDAPEVFVGVLVLVGVAVGLRGDRVAGVVAVPVLALGLLASTTYRGRRRAPGSRP